MQGAGSVDPALMSSPGREFSRCPVGKALQRAWHRGRRAL